MYTTRSFFAIKQLNEIYPYIINTVSAFFDQSLRETCNGPVGVFVLGNNYMFPFQVAFKKRYLSGAHSVASPKHFFSTTANSIAASVATHIGESVGLPSLALSFYGIKQCQLIKTVKCIQDIGVVGSFILITLFVSETAIDDGIRLWLTVIYKE
jgi:hypothetical protein